MAPILPFRIAVPEADLELLQKKLALATFPDELEDADWALGSRLADMRRLTSYWREKFDWRAQEAQLNRLPQFTTKVEVAGFGELDVHFVHQRSAVEGAVPLLFVHGWPGSFIEVIRLLPLLSGKDGVGPAFHVVAPSLPNFGFSEGVKKRGFGLKQYAEAMNGVMMALGYEEYVTQGGDWGSIISRVMGRLYPKHVKASHLNFFPSQPPWPWSNPILFIRSLLSLPFSTRDKLALKRTQWYSKEGNGYLVEQDSKPQTIGYALHDSPVALLAWIYEKLHDWTDSYPWTDDEVLTWISIYQFSRAGPGASVRIYHESSHPVKEGISRQSAILDYVPGVKLGFSYFPQEIAPMPKWWGHRLGPVVFENWHEKGGHFAAWENPEGVAGDLTKMFGKSGPLFAVVPGRDGYIRD